MPRRENECESLLSNSIDCSRQHGHAWVDNLDYPCKLLIALLLQSLDEGLVGSRVDGLIIVPTVVLLSSLGFRCRGILCRCFERILLLGTAVIDVVDWFLFGFSLLGRD